MEEAGGGDAGELGLHLEWFLKEKLSKCASANM